MTKYILIALAAAAALAGLWGTLEHQRAQTYQARAQVAVEAAGRLQAAVAAQRHNAEASAATSAALAEQINQLRRDAEQKQKALNEALKANPDWAAAAVPDSVWDAIAGPADRDGKAGPGVDSRGVRAPAPRAR